MPNDIDVEQFAAIVAEKLVEKNAIDGAISYDADGLCLLVKDSAGRTISQLFLGNFYREYLKASHDAREHIIHRAATLNIPGEGSGIDDLESVRKDILLHIRDRWVVEKLRLQLRMGRIGPPSHSTQVDIPHVVFTNVFAICAVKDTPEQRYVLTSDQYKALGIQLDEAWDIGLNNLNDRTPDMAFDSTPTRDGEGYHLHQVAGYTDGYTSSRVLLDWLYVNVPVQGKHVFALVGDDRLAITGSEDEVGLAMLLSELEDATREARPLPPFPIWLDEENMWAPFNPPADFELTNEFYRLQELYWQQVYQDQKQLLEGVYEVMENNYSIPDYQVLMNKDREILTVAIVEFGQPTLIPQADLIEFVKDGKKVASVEWNVLVETIGDEIEIPDESSYWNYPPRYLLREFPSPEKFMSMR